MEIIEEEMEKDNRTFVVAFIIGFVGGFYVYWALSGFP